VAAKPTIRTIQRGHQSYVLTDLLEEDYQEYYNGYANEVLWPILHYRLDLAEFYRRDLGGYMRVNQTFATELDKLLRPDDVLWIHDYHLFPLAKALREGGHRNKIGFFHHIPFPPPEILTALPSHQRLIPAMCHYDLVGFQTETDAANFALYFRNECGIPSLDQYTWQTPERVVRIGIFPVGVETAQLSRLARRAAQAPFVRDVVESLVDRAMIIGVDRLDYSKGIALRMEAFDRFLSTNTDWRGKVAYLHPGAVRKSRNTPTWNVRSTKRQAVSTGHTARPRGRQSVCKARPWRAELVGLYRSAQVALVTPLRDGMNLVAKEYVSAQDTQNPGVLILSRFAGAAVELEAALLVNPYDPESVGTAIAQALSMPLDERRTRHDAMSQILLANNVKLWGERFLTTLTRPPNFLNRLTRTNLA
jgi:trehalose 6-phosphate synthase